MELDDLKSAWQSIERRLAAQNAMTFMQLKAERSAQARMALRPQAVGQVMQLLLGVVLAAVFARFWFVHRDSAPAVTCGALLQAYALMLVVFAARELGKIRSIDFSAPVLEIQKSIAELRAWRIRIAPIFAAIGCFIWIPFLLAIFSALGSDEWAKDPNVIWWLIGNGAVVLAIKGGFVLWARLPGQAQRRRRLEASLAGRGVERARSALAEIAEFERDAVPGNQI